ncbi:MAG TPA: DUF4398 domain-containing protein, partial [Polyangiaceae bacterium]|nr:DUF4398 domain-containing protein [Polyangiaceae bacterium]
MNKRVRMQRNLVAVVCVAWLSAACGAAVPPKELVDARAAYERASKSRANELAPAELDTAKQSLGRAEGSFLDNGDDPLTRDLAYIAERKAMAAEAQAGILEAERQRDATDKDFKKAQLATIDKTKAQLEEEKRAREATRAEADKTKAQLETEKKAREEAEKRASAAMASLAEIAKVKEESRGVVITLSGSVLFATGQSDLLPIAKDKLNEVAKALKDQGFKQLTVEGHTDSRGNAAKNEELSLRR